MAPLPKGFSLQALPIESAISEGRTEDAKTAICELLRAGRADAVVQRLAADLLKPVRRKRGRKKALPRHWFDIGEEFGWLRGDGILYEEALYRVAQKFGCSETHVRTSVTMYERARQEHNEATAEYCD